MLIDPLSAGAVTRIVHLVLTIVDAFRGKFRGRLLRTFRYQMGRRSLADANPRMSHPAHEGGSVEPAPPVADGGEQCCFIRSHQVVRRSCEMV